MGYFDCILALLNLCSNLRVILMYLNACLMMLACVYCTFQCNLFFFKCPPLSVSL